MVQRTITVSGGSHKYEQFEFVNTINPEIVEVELGGKKVLEGWDSSLTIGVPSFNFDLYQADSVGNKIDADLSDTDIDPLMTTSVSGSNTFTFEDLIDDPSTLTVNEATDYLKYDKAGVFYYVITEKYLLKWMHF